ncbi:tRNA-ribosyltransferase [Halobacteriales archaeon SW_5_70_135]|nr:MAG: tRNA-ribosyltransferase [Halobacteriales archaeon SW_5_70_135]
MTEFFEVTRRDGPARLATLRLSTPVTTPAVLTDADGDDRPRPPGAEPHAVIEDGGSLWSAARETPDGDPDRLTVLPHRAFPSGTEPEVEAAFDPTYPAVEAPTAAVVSPETAADRGTDAYLLSTVTGVADHAAALVDAVVTARAAIPDDAALCLAGVATPRNLPVLVGVGVDLVDDARAVVRGTQGRYLTGDGAWALDDLAELPCACPVCRDAVPDAITREDCVAHNRAALVAAARRTREAVRRGTLRDYLEGQVRHDDTTTALLRRLDEEWDYAERRAPLFRPGVVDDEGPTGAIDASRGGVRATTEDTLRRPEVRRFADRVTERYRCRYDAPLALVPCSARKPYTESRSHAQFHRAVDYRAHTVSITSPIGVVPQELERTYPAAHYDSVVTGRWTATEVEFVSEVLARYLRANEYPYVVAHVPEEYRPVCRRAFERVAWVESTREVDGDATALDGTASLAGTAVFTVGDHPTTADSLAALSAALEGEGRYRKRERQRRRLRAVADYQFGAGAGDALFPEFEVGGREPQLRVRGPVPAGYDGPTGSGEGDDRDGVQLAALVPEYGLLSLSLAGAHRWLASDVPTERVEIDDFVPHGSVLAPGVVDADPSVRVGDEVVVEGPQALAVGRARAHGAAMVESSRGVVVDVRHVAER